MWTYGVKDVKKEVKGEKKKQIKRGTQDLDFSLGVVVDDVLYLSP